MTEHIRIMLKDDKFVFVVVPAAGEQATDDSLYGEWRHKLVEAKFASKFNRMTTSCSATDVNSHVLFARWGESIVFDHALTEVTFQRQLLVGQMRQRVATIHAEWSDRQYVPPSDIEVHPENPLAPYQRVPVIASRLTPGYALFMEQGTGKTPVVISRTCTDARDMRESGETRMYRAIVVCPKNLRRNWQREFSKFGTVKGKVTVLRSGGAKRIRELADAMRQVDDELYTVVVISYGLLCQAWESVLQFVDWDLAVLDEGHAIKWHQTDRTQHAWKLRDKARARMLLTGTPVVNSALDLFSQLEFLDAGLSGHTTFSGFREKYGVYAKTSDNGRDVLLSIQNMPLLKRRLAECSFIVRKDQVLSDLPPKQYDICEVEMTKRQWDDYDSLASKLYLEIEDDLRDAEETGTREFAVNNALVKLLKLAQITSGFLNVPAEVDEFGEVTSPAFRITYTPNPKLDQLIEEAKSLPPMEKMLVWTCYIPDIETMSARFNAEGLDHVTFCGSTSDADRAIAEDRINRDPSCRFFIGNPEAGGAGLNLLGYVAGENDDQGYNVTRMIYFSQNHKPVGRWQSEDRSHRRGTRVPVRITDLVVAGTIDEEIRVRVLEKKKHALDVQDLREMLAGLLRRRE